MIDVILVDDERAANKSLQLILEDCFDEIKVVDVATRLSEAERSIRLHKPDIVFLDIELPDGNGLQLLDAFPDPDFTVIFVTAYNEYAIRAIKKNAFDYLLKPVEIDELAETLARHRATVERSKTLVYPSIIDIPSGAGKIFIKVNQIIRVEAKGSYCQIFCKDDITHLVSTNLKSIEQYLEPGRFFRCHNSHIIHLGKVKELVNDGSYAIMDDHSEVLVSHRRKNDFFEAIRTYKEG